MKDRDREFAIRKDDRNSQRLRRFFGSFFGIALLVIAFGLYGNGITAIRVSG